MISPRFTVCRMWMQIIRRGMKSFRVRSPVSKASIVISVNKEYYLFREIYWKKWQNLEIFPLFLIRSLIYASSLEVYAQV